MDLAGLTWRKASDSGSQGSCVEVGTWRKSSRSGSQTECVEVASARPWAVAVRDSKDPGGPALLLTPAAWRAFTANLCA